MSGEPKTHTLTERESYLISRVGDAWVELNRKHYDFARDELAEAQIAADDVTEAAARARDEANEFKGRAERAEAAIREWVEAERPYLDMGRQPTFQEHTRFSEAIIALRRLAGGENKK